MDFLKTQLFTSFLVSSLYFIVKNLFLRMNTSEEEKEWVRKTVLKDSILLFILTYLILIFKDQIFFSQTSKTEVFMNEPSF